MSDVQPAPRLSTVRTLTDLAELSGPAFESALAELAASRASELAREAWRVVRALDVAPSDRRAALGAVATIQRALFHDVATGRVPLEPRAWRPTVRAESARAVRTAAAQGAVTVAPRRQHLAAQRATLLAVRENAIPPTPPTFDAPVPQAMPATQVLPVVPVVPFASAVGAAPEAKPSVAAGPRGRGPHRSAAPTNPRHVRHPAGPGGHRHVTAQRSLRWGAAALLSSVTIVVGAAVAPAEERPLNAPGSSSVSFVDRLTLPILGMWNTLVSGGEGSSPSEVAPVDEAPDPTPPAAPPAVAPPPGDQVAPPGPTAPKPPVAPSPPPAVVPPGTGSSTPHDKGGRRDWRDDDGMGRGEGHGRDDDDHDDDEDDDDESRQERDDGRSEEGRKDGRQNGRGDDHGHRGSDGGRGRGRHAGVRLRRHEGVSPRARSLGRQA
ncbi:hypothetical protein [Oerskovia turbata]